MSLGGYGTLDFAGQYPEIVTAAVALCGGGNPRNGCNLSTIPVWIQHGNKDAAVPISESEKMVKSIKSCNGIDVVTVFIFLPFAISNLVC